MTQRRKEEVWELLHRANLRSVYDDKGAPHLSL